MTTLTSSLPARSFTTIRRLIPTRRSMLGVLRVCVYAFFASLLCAALGARAVYADFGEASLEVGRELAGLDDVLGSTKTLSLNGVVMNVSTALTEESPSTVLDRFETVCRAHPEMLARAMSELPATLLERAEKAQPDARLRLGIVRKEIDGHGVLTCFMDDRTGSLPDAIAHLKRFVATRDFGELGRFRYVYADRTATGRTHVTTIWTNDHLRVSEMFPAIGDAPGDDSSLVPRPPGAKRIFSGATAGLPFGVRIYQSARSEAAIREFYATEMPPAGWVLASDLPSQHGSAYMREGGIVLYLSIQPRGEGSVVTLTETARAATPRELRNADGAARNDR